MNITHCLKYYAQVRRIRHEVTVVRFPKLMATYHNFEVSNYIYILSLNVVDVIVHFILYSIGVNETIPISE